MDELEIAARVRGETIGEINRRIIEEVADQGGYVHDGGDVVEARVVRLDHLNRILDAVLDLPPITHDDDSNASSWPPSRGHPDWCTVVEAHNREDCRR